MQRIPSRNSVRRLRSPGNVIQLYHVFIVHKTTTNMPQSNSIFNTKTWTSSGSQDEFAVWAPLTDTWIATFDGADLLVILFEIIDIHLPSKVSKTSNQNKTTGWGKQDCISGPEIERMGSNSSLVENGCLGWHVSVDHSKLFRIGGPRYIMNWAFLVQSDSRIKSTICTQHI